MSCIPNDPAIRSVAWLTPGQARALRCELAAMVSGDEAGACRIVALRRRALLTSGSPAPGAWTVAAGSLHEIRATVAGLAAARDATPGAVFLAAFGPAAAKAVPLGPREANAAGWVSLCLGPGALAVDGTTRSTVAAGALTDLGARNEVELRSGAMPCQALLVELIPRPSWREMFVISRG